MNTPPIDKIDFRGGSLCLDFINTTNWVDESEVDERLLELDDFAIWVTRQNLGELANAQGDIRDIRQLRAIVRRLVLKPDDVAPEDIRFFDSFRSVTAPLDFSASGARLSGPSTVENVAALIAASAAQLLLEKGNGRIKQCPGDRCGWLFLDESPANRRRWCAMAECGNRAKARRFYENHKSTASA